MAVPDPTGMACLPLLRRQPGTTKDTVAGWFAQMVGASQRLVIVVLWRWWWIRWPRWLSRRRGLRRHGRSRLYRRLRGGLVRRRRPGGRGGLRGRRRQGG